MKLIQPRELNVRKTIVVALAVLGLIVWQTVRRPVADEPVTLRGQTMGTTYAVTIADGHLAPTRLRQLQAGIDTYLEGINQEMSTYLPGSEISRFNESEALEPIAVSSNFITVTRFALELSHQSGGAFDPTVGRLVELWGFAGSETGPHTPTTAALDEAGSVTGHEHLFVEDQALRKGIPGLRIDLSAIAKGYAVDGVASLLQAAGVSNLLVEIGGECVARGRNARGQPWRLGLDTPAYGAVPGERLHTIVPLEDQAIATSGDYRNFREDTGGRVRSHIIDPRTAEPVQHRLASVSVVAENCMTADAVATTLFVMGMDESIAWLERHPRVEALFIIRKEGGEFEEYRTPGFMTLELDAPTSPR